MREFVVEANAQLLLRTYLQAGHPAITTGVFAKAVKTKAVKVNGKPAVYNQKVKPHDTVQLYLPDHFFTNTPAGLPFLAAGFLGVPIYEDDNLLIGYKPAGLLSTDGEDGEVDTYINRCKRHLFEKGEYKTATPPLLCHRLDRGTSGMLVTAKNAAAHAAVLRCMANNNIEKTYLCVTTHAPAEKAAHLKAYLTKNATTGTVQVSAAPKNAKSRPIETAYEALAVKNGLALLKVTLITGRTHQIRAHLAFIGCPLLGDGKYGNEKENRLHKTKYQALCATALQFNQNTAAEPLVAPLAGKTLTARAPWFLAAFEDGSL